MLGTEAFWSTVRLFVALWPPPAVVDLVRSLPRPDVAGVRWTTPEQWHVTLRFLGEAAPDQAVAALSAVAWAAAPVAVTGERLLCFGQEVLVLPVEGVAGMAAHVEAATAGIGRPPPSRPFAGHLTLARARRGGDVRPAGGTAVGQRVWWRPAEVTLVASHLQAVGARYQVVERWVLEPNTRS
jgi:2'-5' RNA ligase